MRLLFPLLEWENLLLGCCCFGGLGRGGLGRHGFGNSSCILYRGSRVFERSGSTVDCAIGCACAIRFRI